MAQHLFKLIDSDGHSHAAIEIKFQIDASSLDGPAEEEGLSEFRLVDTRGPLNYNADGTFTDPATGKVLRRA